MTEQEHTPSAAALMPLMGFTLADLQANRDGTIGENQADHLRRTRAQAIFISGLAFVVIVLMATTCLFIGARNNAPILTLAGIGLTIINAVQVGFFGRQIMRLNADLREGAIVVTAGQLERVVRTSGRAHNFVLRVNNTDFSVKKELFKLFRHEQDYAIYCAARSRVLLAAEPLNAQTTE